MPGNKTNILLWGFGNDCTCGVREYLADDIDIKVWIDKGKYRTTTHSMENLHNRPYTGKRSDRIKMDYKHREEFLDIYGKLMKYADVFLYKCSRHLVRNRENNFLDMMEAFHIYIHLFIDILKTNRISSVFFSDVLNDIDLILYLVAKEMNIKAFILEGSMTPGKSFLSDDIEPAASIETGDKNIRPVTIRKSERQNYFYMKRKISADIINAFSALLFRRNMDLFLHRIMRIRNHMKFGKNDDRLLANLLPTGKFVYFALHDQPRLSTLGPGRKFVDQILAVEHLRALLPDDWSIVVKENPRHTSLSRGSFFITRLEKIPGVFYLHRNLDTFMLIEKSAFTSTITGTVGLEALSFGKRVLIFGSAAYRNFPGVIRYNDHLTLEDILSVQFSHEDLELAHAKLQHNMVDVIVHPRFTRLVESFSKEKNARALADIINKATR